MPAQRGLTRPTKRGPSASSARSPLAAILGARRRLTTATRSRSPRSWQMRPLVARCHLGLAQALPAHWAARAGAGAPRHRDDDVPLTWICGSGSSKGGGGDEGALLVLCPNAASRTGPERQLLRECGAKLDVMCPACAAAEIPWTEVCGNCGTPLAAGATPPAARFASRRSTPPSTLLRRSPYLRAASLEELSCKLSHCPLRRSQGFNGAARRP